MERHEIFKNFLVPRTGEALAKNQKLREYVVQVKKENEDLRKKIHEMKVIIEEMSLIMELGDHLKSNII